MPTPLADELQQTASRSFVVFMHFEMLDQLVDTICQKRYLDLGRTGILGVKVVLLDDNLFFSGTKRHGLILL